MQLQLLNPQASFFDDADLLIAADCVPFALASFHEDFVKGKVPIIFCPKLDHANEQYLDKLTAIFHPARHPLAACGAHGSPLLLGNHGAGAPRPWPRSGKDIPVHDYTISIQGKLLAVK